IACYRLLLSHVLSLFIFSRPRRSPTSPLFPYTTLFRSSQAAARSGARPHRGEGVHLSPFAIHRGADVITSQLYPPYIIERSSRRSEEHTSELQSRGHLVCRLLLEKKKKY